MTLLDWRTAEQQALELKADVIDNALTALERLDGMFAGRGELLAAARVAHDLLATEADNLRKQGERLATVTP